MAADHYFSDQPRGELVLSPLTVADSPGRAGNFSVLLPLCPAWAKATLPALLEASATIRQQHRQRVRQRGPGHIDNLPPTLPPCL